MKSRSGGQKSSANPAANRDQMNTPANHDEDEDQGDVFLDENDIVLEINVDDEGVVQMGSYGPPLSPLSLSLSLYLCFCNFFVSFPVYSDLPDAEDADDDAEDVGMTLLLLLLLLILFFIFIF